MAEMTLKEYALHYASLGLAVFPLRPRDKRPATSNGCKAATTDPERISRWWDEHPDHNIGIATGSISGGLVVIDLDRDEDKGIDGYDTLKKWQKEHGTLPETSMSITGRGGYHYFYKDTAQWQNRVGLYDGVDIRAEGGYVVAPPSIHPNGRRYEWEQPLELYDITEVDSRVIQFMSPVSESWEREPFQIPDQILEGARTDTLVRLVCSQQAKGLSDEAIRAAVRAENETRCSPPLTDRELEKEVFPAIARYQKGTSPYDKAAKENKKSAQCELIPLSTVDATEATFLWYPYIPDNKITIMLADPGVGKTTLCLKLASIVSKGEPFYMESEENPFEKREPGFVIYQTAEDGIADTIVPRLQKMNANLNNICVIKEDQQALTFTDGRIEQALQIKQPRLMIFDPIQAYLGSDLDMHRANEVRPVLTELSRLAEKYHCSMILIAHMSKMSSNSALYRALGSVDIVALARSELILVNKPNDPDKHKLMTHEKSSLAAHGKSVEFHIDYSAGGIVFDGYSDLKADDILGQHRKKKEGPSLEDAKDFLKEMLEKGYADLKEIQEEAEEREIKKSTLYNAKKKLHLHSRSSGYGESKKTIWYFKDYEPPEDNSILMES